MLQRRAAVLSAASPLGVRLPGEAVVASCYPSLSAGLPPCNRSVTETISRSIRYGPRNSGGATYFMRALAITNNG